MVSIIKAGATTMASSPDFGNRREANATVAGLADGGYVVTYSSTTDFYLSEAYSAAVTNDDSVFAVRYSASGALVATYRVDTSDASTRRASSPDVVALSDGGFAIGFSEEMLGYSSDVPSNSAQYQEALRYRVYDADGGDHGLQTQASVSASYVHNNSRIFSNTALAASSGNQFAFSYYDAFIGPNEVVAVTANGPQTTPSFYYSTSVADMEESVAVASLNNGSLVSIWTPADGDGDGYGVFMRVLDASNQVVVEKTRVNTTNVASQYQPDVAALSTGGFVVVWTSLDTGNPQVMAQRYTASGQRAGLEFAVNTVDRNVDYLPTVAAFDDGGFVVVWMGGAEIMAQRFLANGAKDGGEIVVGIRHVDSPPSVAVLKNGSFIVTWAADMDGDGDIDVASKVFGPATEGTTATIAVEVIDGTAGADILYAARGVFTAGDQIDLGGGIDELRLTSTGTLDLTAPTVFKGVEKLTGTSGNDTFVVSQERLAGITTFSLGGGTDTFRIEGPIFTLRAGVAVARLTANDLTSTAVLNITGNELAQTITGNEGENTLRGLGGNDILDGRGGADMMYGGTGDDTYYVNNYFEQVFENAGEGMDTVLTVGTFLLGSGIEIEVIRTRDDAGLAELNLFGNEFNQTLIGNNGANRLDGRGGADSMRGLGGNDEYAVDDVGDKVIEAVNGGFDRVTASVSYVLSANIEDLILTGDAAIDGTGNASANTIYGNDAANRIDGKGGADTMDGGAGADIYFVDDAGDKVIEANGPGVDTVLASVNYTLAAGQWIEQLYTGSVAATTALKLTGNEIANTLRGNAGSNTLNGGAGADVMRGLGGNDVYVVDNVGDQVIEAAGGGSDTVRTSISYTLGAGQEIEALTTTLDTGTASIKLTGNEFGQLIRGNAGANTINGGAGADRLYGLGGNDTYVVDNAGDLVFESAGGGADTVITTVNYMLALGQEIETLQLSASIGTRAAYLVGNEFANTLVGSAGANTLNGRAGSDTLTGGGGADTFVFDTTLGSNNIDRITDFSIVNDTIRLDQSIFTRLSLGTLSAAAFKEIGTGGGTIDSNDLIIYNNDTGALFYDSNGATSGGLKQFATLVGHPNGLTNADFFVVA